MEAWLHGAALNAQVPALKDLLEGLSTSPASDICTLYVCIAAPRGEEDDGGASVELYLNRDVSIPGTLWRVRHQARPMAGEKAEKLVAAVREVQEAQTLSGNAYPLFAAMGFKMQYQVMRRGLRYTMLVGTQVVELSLMVLEGQGEDGQPAVVVPGLWLLEACCKTTQETYQDAVAALAVVKERLADVVTLTRPPLGLRGPGDDKRSAAPRAAARGAAA